MNLLPFLVFGTLVLAYMSYEAYISGQTLNTTLLAAMTVIGIWASAEKARAQWFNRDNPYL